MKTTKRISLTTFALILSMTTFISCDKDEEETTNVGVGEATATTDPGAVINGVRWATRNVDAFGTFAATPEDFGMSYQWNRKKAWAATGSVSGWDSSKPEGTEWTKDNDPSPAGWRVPTIDQIKSLLDANKVSWTWSSTKKGWTFTDKTTGASIFLPAVGGRDHTNGTIYYAGSGGYYWSRTQWSPTFAYYLCYSSTTVDWSYISNYEGYPVRSVAE